MSDVYSIVDALATARKALTALADRLKSDSRVVSTVSDLILFRFVSGPNADAYTEATLTSGEVFVWYIAVYFDSGDHSWSITASVRYHKVAGADQEWLVSLADVNGNNDEAFIRGLAESVARLASIELDEAIASRAKASISEA